MLSNKDFANLVKSGNLGDGNGKTRYDLKQVVEWDKQIDSQYKKFQKKTTKKEERSGPQKTIGLPPGYRDRVAERKASEATEKTLDSEEVTTTVTIPSSGMEKDLVVGPEVKGLDFALLAKIRQQAKDEIQKLERKLQPSNSFYSDESDNEDVEMTNDNNELDVERDLEEIEPKTKVGFGIKKFLLKQRELHCATSGTTVLSIPSNGKEEKLSTLALLNNLDKTGKAYVLDPTKVLEHKQQLQAQQKVGKSIDSALQRSIYEYNINPLSLTDVPLTIVKSRKESKFTEAATFCQLLPELFNKVLAVFENGKIVPKGKRQQPEKKGVPSSSSAANKTIETASLPKPIKPVGGIDSIYDDIEEKYDPLTSIMTTTIQHQSNSQPTSKRSDQPVAVFFSDDEEDSVMKSELLTKPAVAEIPTQSLKGLFHNIRQTAVEIPTKQTSSVQPTDVTTVTSFTFSSAISGASSVNEAVSDLTISKAEKAKRRREELKVSYGAVQEFHTSSTMGEDRNIIHRDVFATTLDNVVEADRNFGKKAGDTFGPQGEYDLFPETGGEVELGSDDEGGGDDEEGSKPIKKKPRLNGSGTGSMSAGRQPGGSGLGESSRSSATPWNRVKGAMTPATKFRK